MPVSTDISRTYRRPRAVVEGLAAQGRREDRVLIYLMIGLVFTFLAQLPILQRAAVLEGADFRKDATYAFFSTIIIAPLLFYLLAEVARWVARVFGLVMDAFGGRLALFWAWLAAAPILLLYGLLSGFNGPEEPGTRLIGAIWVGAILWFWVQGLRAVSRAQD